MPNKRLLIPLIVVFILAALLVYPLSIYFGYRREVKVEEYFGTVSAFDVATAARSG